MKYVIGRLLFRQFEQSILVENWQIYFDRTKMQHVRDA